MTVRGAFLALILTGVAHAQVVPTLSKSGQCRLIMSGLPQRMWESAVTFDQKTGELVHHGGHVTYEQSSYTYLYHPDRLTVRRARPERTPPRVCLQDGTYIDSREVSLFAHYRAGHGSIPPGGFKNGDYTVLKLVDDPGPWLYDGETDNFEFARPAGTQFAIRSHAPMAYDPSSDVVFSLDDKSLSIYSVHRNQVSKQALPAELQVRRAYGIAVDPLQRKLVVFGGVAPTLWQFLKLDSGAKDSKYRTYVKDDTWLYDIPRGAWQKLTVSVRPPRGFPGSDFVKHMMVYDVRNGLIVLRVTPINDALYDRNLWPRAETWGLSVGTKTWQRLNMNNEPRFAGLTTYDSVKHRLVIMGGGDDAPRTNDQGVSKNIRPALSRQLYVCDLPLQPDAFATADPKEVTVTSLADGANTINWPPESGVTYTVDRAEVVLANGVFKPPDAFAAVGTVTGGQFIDAAASKTKYYAYRVGRTATTVRSLVAFDQPATPGDMWALVDNENQVTLRWRSPKGTDIVGYNIYRARGSEILDRTHGRLNSRLVAETHFLDKTVDLSDGVARFYFVKAVNRSGKESGASPYALTFPEAPLAVNVQRSSATTMKISWQWPDDVPVKGFKIYYNDNHLNTHGKPKAVVNDWYASWKAATVDPVTANSYVFAVSAGSTARHYYFYVRAVNRLGQEGFRTDIVSPTARPFIPHVSDTPVATK